MKQKTNCPNCSAPLEIGEIKCPYCGTIYYDLSAIDFDAHEPIFLTIKYNNMIITQKAIPQLANFEISTDTVYATGGLNHHKLVAFPVSHKLQTNVTFEAVASVKNTLCEVKYNE